MRYIFIIILVFFGLHSVYGQTQEQRKEIQTKSGLALRYYNARDFEKAVPLLEEVYRISKNSAYYRYYINGLVQLERFEEAEKSIQGEIRKLSTSKSEFLIHQGYVLKAQGYKDEAEKRYREAIGQIPANKGNYLIAAGAFINWGEYEFARQTYLRGREILAPEQFNYEIARTYMYLRDYENMLLEYLNLLRYDDKQLARVQSSLSSALRLDIDNGLREVFKKQILKRIQTDPSVTGYVRLLIWFYLQEKRFSSANRQIFALDRRTGAEASQILQLGSMALKNQQYGEARKAFDYLLGKGPENPFYGSAYSMNIHASYMEFTTQTPLDTLKGTSLAQFFEEGLQFLGYAPATLNLVKEYAHLLAFYLGRTDEAIAILEKGLKVPQLKPNETGMLKTELADISVYADDPWEAMLVYSQVIDENKTSYLGDEAKLKKARLGYYMGNFSWAKAMLDVLKASTSKLTANDALDLSILIGNNLNMDTTAVPLQMFARADLLFFRNKDQQAMAVLDSLASEYPYHTLVDDILFRKAKIEIEAQNYALAAEHLENIITGFSYDLLGDDALYMLAELYHYNLDQKEKAKELYRQMLDDHPGSVFAEESRLKYRELREIYPDKEPGEDADLEELFMEGKNEFQ